MSISSGIILYLIEDFIINLILKNYIKYENIKF